MAEVRLREATELQSSLQPEAEQSRAQYRPWNELSAWQKRFYRLRAFWSHHVVIGVGHEQCRDHFGRHIPKAPLFLLSILSQYLLLQTNALFPTSRCINAFAFYIFLRFVMQSMLVMIPCMPIIRFPTHPRACNTFLYGSA